MRFSSAELTVYLILALVVTGLSGLSVSIALYLGDAALLRDTVRGVIPVYTTLAMLLAYMLRLRK